MSRRRVLPLFATLFAVSACAVFAASQSPPIPSNKPVRARPEPGSAAPSSERQKTEDGRRKTETLNTGQSRPGNAIGRHGDLPQRATPSTQSRTPTADAGSNPKSKIQNPKSSAPVWNWIWAEGESRPPETVYFRHRFTLNQRPTSARLLITGDDRYTVHLNETTNPVVRGSDWTTVQEFDVTRTLSTGENLLAIEVQNQAGRGGLIYKLILRLPNGRTQTLVSNARVRVARRVPPQWDKMATDDRTWASAREIAPGGQGDWGALHFAPRPDATQLVRLWDIRAGGDPDANPYAHPRSVGDRMLLSASVTSSSEMQILAGAGFTLFQSDADHLSTNETAPDRWDWRIPLAARDEVTRLGLNWCYFPHFAFPPAWYRDKVPFTRLSCLEHNAPIQEFSLWDPTWPAFVDRGYTALASAFEGFRVRGSGFRVKNADAAKGNPDKTKTGKETTPNPEPRTLNPAALYVGISGDYGQAGMPSGERVVVAGQKEDWQRRFGNLHDHLGWWCGDSLARADFRAQMLAKYETLERLNAVWKRDFKKPDDIVYPDPFRPRPEARVEWLDFVTWYQDSVGRVVEMNLSAARKHFPDSLLMLPCYFADEDPRGGNDDSLLPKLAAKYGAAVRSTHGGLRPFAENAARLLGRLGSASRFYGAPLWVEPANAAPGHEAERVFEAISQGAQGWFEWAETASTARDAYYRYGKYLRVEKPVVDVAMFYPADAQKLRPEQGYAGLFARVCTSLRDVMNYDIVDDRMVSDGCLSRYRVLVLWEGMQCDQSVLDKIRAWVEDGGVILAYNFGKVSNFEGDQTWFNDLFGYNQELPQAKMTERYAGAVPAQYRILPNSPGAAEFLDDGWHEAEKSAKGASNQAGAESGNGGRWTKAKAQVRLPVEPDKEYTLVVRAFVPQEAANLSRRVLLNGRQIGTLAATGDVTYRFPIQSGLLDDVGNQNLATLTFQSDTFQPSKAIAGSSDTRSLGVQVVSIQMVAKGEAEVADADPLSGVIQRQYDISKLATSWARKLGKGLTIFYPATRQQLPGYYRVIRRAVYNLSEIEKGRRDALPLDNDADGVYATLFTDKALFYNPKETRVTKTVTIPAEAWAAWRGEVAIPKQTTWELTIEPHSMGAIWFGPEPQELLFECEKFTNLDGFRSMADTSCSPGRGQTCVPLENGAAISTRFNIETAGSYAVFTRCVQKSKPALVDVTIDGKPISVLNARAGQTMLSGTANLSVGTHTLTIRARPGQNVRADFVLLTNDATIGGYDFALRSPLVE